MRIEDWKRIGSTETTVFSHAAFIPFFSTGEITCPPNPSIHDGDERGKLTHSFPGKAQ
jgi:hypothetical protein